MPEPILWSPLRIGPVTVRNRVVFSAHLTNYATQDGLPSEQHAAYYAARAAGGVGLIITEEHSTHPTDWPYEKLIHGFNPKVLDGYRRITDAVHRYRTPIFAQINHNGGQASSMYSRLPVWAPSPVADPLFREVPKAVSAAEIAEIVAGYADVAARCAEGGFDGIELQCSHSSIVRGFLSPATNRRTDAYGGPLEHRARLLLEVIDAVRAEIGDDLALLVRFSATDWTAGGWSVEDTCTVARWARDHGADLFDVSSGGNVPARIPTGPGYQVGFAAAVREATGTPVAAVGIIEDAFQAEQVLVTGQADAVLTGRGMLRDPHFPLRAAHELGAGQVRVPGAYERAYRPYV